MAEADDRWSITKGKPDDAPNLISLLRGAFDSRYFVMSVYRAPKAVNLLRERLQEGDAGAMRVRVIRSEENIVGCTLVDRAPTSLHLSYVAAQGGNRGIGRALMTELHEESASIGRPITLDVFESNSTVVDWYRRIGFQEESRSHSLVVNFRAVDPSRPAFLDARSLDAAVRAEAERGVSSVHVRNGDAEIAVGLIGGDTLRVVSPAPLGDAALASSLRATFPERSTLLLLQRAAAPSDLPLRLDEVSVRMRRLV